MADGHDVFDAKIVAIDQASGVIGKIIASLQRLRPTFDQVKQQTAGMGVAMKGAGRAAQLAGPQIKQAAHPGTWAALAAHANIFRGHLAGIRSGMAGIGGAIGEFVPALAGLSAGAGLVELFALTDKVSEKFAELSKSAKIAGTTTQGFEQLSFAARMTDVSVESMSGSMFKMNRVIGDATAGKNKDALALFQHLGIHLRDANGKLVDSAKIMPQLAEAFKNTADPAMQARMAMMLFGKAGKEMLPMLTMGSAELAEFSRRSDELRYPFTDADKHNLEMYHRSMIGLGVAVSGFANEIGAQLAPVLEPIITQITDWVAANRDWIATAITDNVKQLVAWVEKLDLHQIVTDTMSLGHEMATALGHVGGMATGIGALVLAMGSPLLLAVSSAMSIFAGLGGVIKGLSVIMYANPLLLIAGAIAFVAVEIMRAWDPMKSFWENIWAGIKLACSDAWAIIKPIFNALKSGLNMFANSAIGRMLHLDVAHSGGDGINQAPGDIPVAPGEALPNLYPPSASGGGGGTQGAPRDGTVRTEITINGLPHGSTVKTSSDGIASRPDVNVGYANLLAVQAW